MDTSSVATAAPPHSDRKTRYILLLVKFSDLEGEMREWMTSGWVGLAAAVVVAVPLGVGAGEWLTAEPEPATVWEEAEKVSLDAWDWTATRAGEAGGWVADGDTWAAVLDAGVDAWDWTVSAGATAWHGAIDAGAATWTWTADSSVSAWDATVDAGADAWDWSAEATVDAAAWTGDAAVAGWEATAALAEDAGALIGSLFD